MIMNIWKESSSGTKQWKTSFPKVIASESCEILKVDFNDTFLKYCCLIYFMDSLIICLGKVSPLAITHKYYTVLLESAGVLDNSIGNYQLSR